MSVSQPTLNPVTLDRPQTLWQNIFTLPNLLTLLYLVVGGSLVIHHGIWRDEAQAFLIARDSTWPLDVIRNTRYEGHPPLWHLILYLVTRLTINPAAMQWLHLFMAAGSVYLVARFSPFPTRAKILFAFGYFTLFEYAIIARNYQLFLLLTLAFCTLWQQGLGKARRTFIWLGLILAGLCLSHVLGIILAAGLGLMLLLDSGFTRDGWRSIARNPFRFACGILIAGLGAWLAVKSLIPEPDNNYNSPWSSDLNPNHVQRTLSTLWNAYVPIPEWGDWRFWNTNFMGEGGFDNLSYLGKPNPNSPWNTAAYRGTWMAVIALILMSLSWRAVGFFLISTLGLLAFTHYKFGGNLRHHGALFVALVAAFWIALTFYRPRPAILWIVSTFVLLGITYFNFESSTWLHGALSAAMATAFGIALMFFRPRSVLLLNLILGLLMFTYFNFEGPAWQYCALFVALVTAFGIALVLYRPRPAVLWLVLALVLLGTTYFNFRDSIWLHGASLVAMVAAFEVALIFYRPRPILWLISTPGLLTFTHCTFEGSTWHYSALCVAMIAAFGIALIFHRPPPTILWRRILWTLPREALVILLLLQAIGGYIATYYAWRHPFSPAREAAALLRPQLTPDDQLFGWYAPTSSTLAAFIPDRKIYYPEDGRWGTFAIWKSFPGGMRSDLQGAYDFARQTGKPVIYISPNNLGRAPTVTGPLGIFSPRPAPATYLGGLPAGMIDNESYYFYRVMPPPPPASTRSASQAATRQ